MGVFRLSLHASNRIVAGMQWSDDMELAIELAREAAAEGEVTVGAVVLDAGGAVIGSGRNLREAHADGQYCTAEVAIALLDLPHR